MKRTLQMLSIMLVVCLSMTSIGYATDQVEAQKIMGNNYVGPEVATEHFGVNFSADEFQTLSDVPFSANVLRKYRSSHVLVFVPNISLCDIRDAVESTLFRDHDADDCANETNEDLPVNWHLISKYSVLNSGNRTWNEQIALLSEKEIVPTTHVLSYTVMAYYKTTDEKLFEYIYVRTSTARFHDLQHEMLGEFNSRGLDVSGFSNTGSNTYLSLSSEIRPSESR